MLLPDPLKALREMARVLKPDGGACTVVFAGPEANPCIRILMSTALRHAELPPRDPCQRGGLLSLGQPDRIDELFRRAGFRDVATTRLAALFRLPTALDYIAFVRASAGPIHEILAGLTEEARERAWQDIEEQLGVYHDSSGWAGPNELLLTAGRR